MKTPCRNVLVSLCLCLICLWSGHTAHAQSPVSPLLGPTLNYTLVSGAPSGTELIDLRLTGYIFSPSELDSLTGSQVEHYTIVSIGETGFESQGGTVDFAYGITRPSSPTANDGDEDWVYAGDFTVKAKPAPPGGTTGAPAVPEDPLPPSDPKQPLDFLIEASSTGRNGLPLHLYDQPFTLTNEDGTTEVITPGPFAAPAVPEPSSLALLGMGLLGLFGLAARRRRV